MDDDKSTDADLSGEFRIKRGVDTESRIKQTYDEIDKTFVNTQNYKKIFDDVSKQNNAIFIQIENEYNQYLLEKQKYQQQIQSGAYSNAVEEKMVPIELFDTVYKMIGNSKEIAGWLIYAHRITEMTLKKLAAALEEAHSFEIKKDTLKEMREMEDKRNQLFLEIMNTRMAVMDSKFLVALESIQKGSIAERREIVSTMSSAFVDAMKTQQETMNQLVDLISKSYPDQWEQVQNIKRAVDGSRAESYGSAVKRIDKTMRAVADPETFNKKMVETSVAAAKEAAKNTPQLGVTTKTRDAKNEIDPFGEAP